MYMKIKKRGALTFKRWKRTPWAAFASLGKSIRIGVLCVAYSLLVFNSKPALAQSKQKSADETLMALEELVINTERPSPFQPLVRVVAVIQQQEIERAAVRNIQDLLRYVQGADLRSRGSEGVQADLNILGGTFDQTIIFINGVNFTDPQTGHHSLNIPVEISQIKRIELLQGPGAWSDGAVAYSGAINIITNIPSSQSLQGNFAGGQYGYFKSSLNAEFSNNPHTDKSQKVLSSWNISGQAGGGYSRSDGYSENTDFDILNLYANISAKDNSGNSIDFQTGYQEKKFGANSFYSLAYPEQYENTRVFLSSLKYLKNSPKFQIGATIYHRRHHDRFELFRHQTPDWYNSHNYHMTDVVGANAKIAYRWGRAGSTVLGADYRFEHIYSTVLGDYIDNEGGNTSSIKAVPGEKGVFFTRSKGRNTPSLYIRHILQLYKWRFTAGIMGANTIHSGDGPDYGSRVYAGLAAAYKINHYLEASGWINNSYRNPTFTDLYYKSPTQTGNLDLKPEEAVATQLEVRFTNHRSRASVSAFYRYGYNIIDWIRETGSDQWRAANITNIETIGTDFNFTYSIPAGFVSRITASWSWMEVTKKSGQYHSLYATDYLRHKASIGLHHKILETLNASWHLSYQKREGSYPGPDNSEIPYEGFFLTDLKIQMDRGAILPFIEVTNLFNTHYFYLGNLPQPGRWIKGGIQITLNNLCK